MNNKMKTSKSNSTRYAASARPSRQSGRRSRGNSFKLESKAEQAAYSLRTRLSVDQIKGTKQSKKKKNFDRHQNCPNTKKATARHLKQEKKEERQWIAEERKAHEQPILEFIQGYDEPDSPILAFIQGGDEVEYGEDLEYESEDYHSEVEEPLNNIAV